MNSADDAIGTIFNAFDVRELLLAGSEPIVKLYAPAFNCTEPQAPHVLGEEIDNIDLAKIWKEELESYFTEEELIELATFHASSVGIKALTILPQILRNSVEKSEPLIEGMLKAVESRLGNREFFKLV